MRVSNNDAIGQTYPEFTIRDVLLALRQNNDALVAEK